MSWLIAIIVGGLVGWIAYSVVSMRINLFWSIIVGAVGGVLANLASFFGFANVPATTLSILGILSGIVGSVIALVVVNGIAVVSQDRERVSGPAYHQEISERRRRDEDEKYRR